MVKNTHGGCGHKKFARKHTTSKGSSKLRVAEEEGEIYAIATALNGNNMFTCFCIDGITRLGRIRGKFSGGRGKRDNTITIGTWVLVGLREWDYEPIPSKTETASTKKQKLQECDLLEVYSESDKNQLIDSESQDWGLLISNDKSRISGETSSYESDILFASEKDIERSELIQKMNSDTEKKIGMNSSSIEKQLEEEIDFNDI
jgi:translation initiation factor IF-1